MYTFPEWAHQVILKKQCLENHTAQSRIILIKTDDIQELKRYPKIMISLAFPTIHLYQ